MSISNFKIPDKHYFKIGEVASITKLPTHVLRFWETEFKMIKPQRTSSGQRLYRKKDVEVIFRIKHFLYEKKFTIEGAKKHLGSSGTLPADVVSFLEEIRMDLIHILDLLDSKPTMKGK